MNDSFAYLVPGNTVISPEQKEGDKNSWHIEAHVATTGLRVKERTQHREILFLKNNRSTTKDGECKGNSNGSVCMNIWIHVKRELIPSDMCSTKFLINSLVNGQGWFAIIKESKSSDLTTGKFLIPMPWVDLSPISIME